MFDRFSGNNRHFSLSKNRKPSSPKSRQLRFESLENRELLSVTNVGVEAAETLTPELQDGGILLVRGTEGNDRVLIEQSGNTLVLNLLSENDATKTQIWSGPIAEVTQVEFFAFGGDDMLRFEVESPIALYAFGGAGNDVIFGGAGENFIDGGSGDNILVAGTGTTTFSKTEGDFGSNVFALRNESDVFPSGTLNDIDDSVLFFTNKGKDSSGTSGNYNGSIEYTLRDWTSEEINSAISMIEETRGFFGSYNFFKSVNTEENFIRLRIFDYDPDIPFDGINNGDGVIDFNGPPVFTEVLVQQFALNWVATSDPLLSPNPLWSEFSSISWTGENLNADAEKKDFSIQFSPVPGSELLGMVSPEYDWATTLTDVYSGQKSVNPSDDWFAKVAILNEFFGLLNPEHNPPREAPSTVVTTELDIIDPNDGVTSIREALRNLGYSRSDTITFGESMIGKTIKLNGSPLTISKNTIIDASGMNITIDADSKSGIIDNTAESLELIGLTLRGAAGDHAIFSFFAWLDEDGEIRSDGKLSLNGCLVTDNTVTNHTLYSLDSLLLKDSELTNNSSGSDTIHAVGDLVVSDSILRKNQNDTHMLYGNDISIIGVSLEENGVNKNLIYAQRGGKIEILNSRILGNSSLNSKEFLIYCDNSNLEITNSLIAGNSSYRTIYLSSGSGAAFNNTTIAGNLGQIEIASGSTLKMNNSILALTELVSEDILVQAGGTLSVNYSLIGSISSSAVFTKIGSMVGNPSAPFDPVFKKYESYTIWESDLWNSWNFGLNLISPAVDAGNDDLVPEGLLLDLAGNRRIFGDAVDLGAFEIETDINETNGTSTLVIRDLSSEVPSLNVSDLSGLSGRLEWVDEWSSFWVELWVDGLDSSITNFENAILRYDNNLFRVDIEGSLDAAGNQIKASLDDSTAGAFVFSGDTGSNATTGGYTFLARLLIRPALAQESSDEPNGLIGVPLPANGYASSIDADFTIDRKLILESAEGVSWFAEPEQPDALNVYPVLYDLNDDGIVNIADITILIDKFGAEVTGNESLKKYDFNYSGGRINLLDLSLLIRSFGKSREKAQAATTTTRYVAYAGNFPISWETLVSLLSIPETSEIDIALPVSSEYHQLEVSGAQLTSEYYKHFELHSESEEYPAKTFIGGTVGATAISDVFFNSSGVAISELDTYYRYESVVGATSLDSGIVAPELADAAIGLIYEETEADEAGDLLDEIFRRSILDR